MRGITAKDAKDAKKGDEKEAWRLGDLGGSMKGITAKNARDAKDAKKGDEKKAWRLGDLGGSMRGITAKDAKDAKDLAWANVHNPFFNNEPRTATKIFYRGCCFE
ncbi:MAG: hypothetical protein GX946_09560 [Oligosphaeraceae bacterium]|nr:hypothetical protein [Oligosphaeraceae bacterium]